MTLTLDNSLLRKLERFKILPRGIHRGGQIGHRRSPSRGTGLEFADHKEYSPGDDPGRGLIGTVESINAPTFDPRTQSRDAAITVGGNDAAGTTAAVNELVGLIKGFGKQSTKPTTAHHEPGATLSHKATMPAP